MTSSYVQQTRDRVTLNKHDSKDNMTDTIYDSDFYHEDPDENPTLNFELLASTVKWARHEWDSQAAGGAQSMWRQASYAMPTDCGTAACIAGRVALDAGFTSAPELRMWEDAGAFCYWRHDTDPPVSLQGNRTPWSTVGQELLGLTTYEARVLFAGGNNIKDVERIAADIARHHGYEPSW